MIWRIPAKTFLLGEYAALAGEPALLLATSPCFELCLSETPGLYGIHPESPAGRFWVAHHKNKGLSFTDPYHGLGGMGASSAQVIGAYLASVYLTGEQPTLDALMTAYYNHAWPGQGLRPSGYDLFAQSATGCVYINQKKKVYSSVWPFPDLAFILLHTGKKLATHQHLQEAVMPEDISALSQIVEHGKEALDTGNRFAMTESVSAYAARLADYNLVTQHSLNLLEWLNNQTDVLAAKGCGAMGADVILVLIEKTICKEFCNRLTSEGLRVLATSKDLYFQQELIPHAA